MEINFKKIIEKKMSNDLIEQIWGNPVERDLEERYLKE